MCVDFNFTAILPFRFILFCLFNKNITSEWLHGPDLREEKRKHCWTLAAKLGSCPISGFYLFPQGSFYHYRITNTIWAWLCVSGFCVCACALECTLCMSSCKCNQFSVWWKEFFHKIPDYILMRSKLLNKMLLKVPKLCNKNDVKST